MANTPNFALYKPSRGDTSVEVDTSLSDNFTKIDTELKTNKDDITTHKNNPSAHTSENITHADGSVRTILDNHEERLGGLETDTEDLDTRVTDIETLGLDVLAPNLEGRIQTIESDVEGILAPATFDAMDQQSYTFDEYRIGYVETRVKPRSINLSGFYSDITVDASPIIRGLINQGYTTIYLPDKIRLNTPLNLTDLDGISIIGQGRTEPNGETGGHPTTIQLNTGGVAIDLVGAQNMLLKDVLMTDDAMLNPSNVAILEGRSNTNKWAQFNKIDNVKVRMRHDATVNGGAGTIALYNFKSELNTYNHVYFMADKPCVLTVSNIYNITSSFVTHNGEATIKSTAFTGIACLVAKYGHALVLDGVTDTTFDHLYMQRYLYNSDNTEDYAVLITAPYSTAGVDGATQVIDYQVNNITITNFECEIFPSFAKIQAKVGNCTFKGQHTHGEGKIIYIPANDANHSNGLTSSHVQINRAKAIVADTQDYIYAEASSNGFHGNMIYVANSKYLCTALVLSQGNIFFGTAQPKLNMFAGSQYMTFGDVGLLINGRSVGFSYNKPTRTDLAAGSIFYNTNTQLGGISYWEWDTVAWRDCGQIGVRLEATTPFGLRTPYFIGEEILDNVAKKWYKSVGLTSSDWVALN